MIPTLIIDDEEHNRIRIKRLIAENFTNIHVIGEAFDVQTGYLAIQEYRPELVLLDIKLGDGDAFDLLEKFDKIYFKIIFITAYEEYAVKAFKFSALDYLLKPVTIDHLTIAFERAENQILDDLRLQLSSLKTNMHSKINDIIVLRTSEKIYLLRIENIIRCESDVNYTRFFSSEEKVHMVSHPLKEYEVMLEGHGFLRIHKSHLVNISFIESLDRRYGQVILKDQTKLPISRRKKQEILQLLSNL
jgi:two-component system LytT family response regulator